MFVRGFPHGLRLRALRSGVFAFVLMSGLVSCVFDSCAQSAARFDTVPADGISSVRIIAEAGSLDVTGGADVTEVTVEGTACASNSSALEEVELEVREDGSQVVIETKTPGGTARLDFAVNLPDLMTVEIEDGSGGISVRDVAALTLTDGSGDVDVSGVAGEVRVLDDGSGDLEVRRIGGDVAVDSDGSGEILVSETDGSVYIGSDGSGSITITDVAGDLRIDEDGSGGISHSGVKGVVDIPEE